MRTIILIAVGVAAATCAKQQTADVSKPQPVAVEFNTGAQPAVHISSVQVSPQTLHTGQQATVSLHLDSADADAMIRVNWFGPDGWSVFESKAPASSTQVNFTAPGKIFDEPGQYRAEVRTGNVYQGDATVEVQS